MIIVVIRSSSSVLDHVEIVLTIANVIIHTNTSCGERNGSVEVSKKKHFVAQFPCVFLQSVDLIRVYDSDVEWTGRERG